MRIYSSRKDLKGGKVKRLNASIPDDVHKALRVALAEDETNFSDWVRERIGEYLAAKKPKGKRRKGREI